jgi:hypothetical protein
MKLGMYTETWHAVVHFDIEDETWYSVMSLGGEDENCRTVVNHGGRINLVMQL